MCIGPEAMLAMSLASTALGTLANSQAARAQQRKRDDVMAAEAQRQRQIQQQADAQLAQIMPQMERPIQEQKLDALAAESEQQMTAPQNQAPGGDYLPASVGSPQEVKDSIAKQFYDAVQFGKKRAKAASRMSAYGGLSQGNNIELGRSGDQMRLLSNFSRGSSGVVPFELQDANQAGGNWRVAGEALGGLGQIGSLYSLMMPGLGAGFANPYSGYAGTWTANGPLDPRTYTGHIFDI